MVGVVLDNMKLVFWLCLIIGLKSRRHTSYYDRCKCPIDFLKQNYVVFVGLSPLYTPLINFYL